MALLFAEFYQGSCRWSAVLAGPTMSIVRTSGPVICGWLPWDCGRCVVTAAGCARGDSSGVWGQDTGRGHPAPRRVQL